MQLGYHFIDGAFPSTCTFLLLYSYFSHSILLALNFVLSLSVLYMISKEIGYDLKFFSLQLMLYLNFLTSDLNNHRISIIIAASSTPWRTNWSEVAVNPFSINSSRHHCFTT